jgi:hypothetical protein
VAHLGRPRSFGVLVHIGVETRQQRPSKGCSGLSRERVLQNLCDLAFPSLILPIGTLPTVHAAPRSRTVNLRASGVPDTTTRGSRRGRRRQGGLLPPCWGSTPSRVRSLRGDGRGDGARASITPSSGEYRTASRIDRADSRSEARARNRIRGESLRTVSRAD